MACLPLNRCVRLRPVRCSRHLTSRLLVPYRLCQVLLQARGGNLGSGISQNDGYSLNVVGISDRWRGMREKFRL
jgi:hypothetical protein